MNAAAFGLARASAALIFASLALAPATASALPPPTVTGGRVTLLQSSLAPPRARRCLTRVREELAAGGFEVTVSEFGAGDEALWMVDAPGAREGSMATISLIGNPDEGPAELWIVDGVPWGRAVIRRLLVPPGGTTHDDEVLAVRALELLRASALELARGAPPAASTSAPPTHPAPAEGVVAAQASPPAPAVAAAAERGPLSFEVGLSLLESSSALGPAFLPVARLRAEWLSLLELRATVAGFGTQPRVTGPEGTAKVGQAVGLIELRAAFRHGHALRPAIGVGGGVLRISVDGSGNWPYEGLRALRWAGLFDVGAGVTARLGRQISAALELHGQLAAPYPTLRFSNDEVARIARPALFSSITLVAPL